LKEEETAGLGDKSREEGDRGKWIRGEEEKKKRKRKEEKKKNKKRVNLDIL